MIGNDVIPKRLDDGLAWIAEVGRAFSDATGWPMVFRPHGEGPEHGESPETCWVSEIRNSEGPIGRLQIELPQEPGQDRSFMTVCELSRLISSLVSRVVGTAEALERRNRDVRLLLEADTAQRQHSSLQGLLEDYLRMCAELAGFRQAAFFLLSPDGRELHLRAVHGLRPSDVPVPRRELHVAPPDVTAFVAGLFEVHAEEESAYRRWLPADAHSGLCLPVNARSDRLQPVERGTDRHRPAEAGHDKRRPTETGHGELGSLWLYDQRRKSIEQDQLHVVRRMADRITAVLERVVLLHESKIHHRQNNDLQIASQCQRESVPSLQLDDPAFDVAALCASRFELGGDLCEVIPLGEQRVFIAVGDASGDSVPAAMVMSAVRGAVRAMLLEKGVRTLLCEAPKGPFRPKSPDPFFEQGFSEIPEMLASILQRANQTLNGLSATFQFMSLFLGIVDVAAGTLTYSNAGHPPPLLLQGGEIRELGSHGILLGIIPDSRYRSQTVPLEPRDALVAYSDGISEVMDENERIFGAQGIIAALEEAPADSAAGILETVVNGLHRYACPRHNHGDDRTLLVLRLR